MKSCFSHVWPFLSGQHFVSFNLTGHNAKRSVPAKMRFFVLIFSLMLISGNAATWYVDSTATGSHNGTSWINAWTNVTEVTGISAGDFIYISGGTSGSTNTYNISGSDWSPIAGNSSAVVTYQIGQDSSHNGTALFIGNNSGVMFNATSYVTILGSDGDGRQHFCVSNIPIPCFYESSNPLVNLRIAYINFQHILGPTSGSLDLMYMANVKGFEFDHNYVYYSNPGGNSFAYIVVSGSGYNDSLVHDNTIYLPSGNGGYGSDGIESGGSTGLSIYNNTIESYTTSYTYTQHQDAFQDTGGSSYIKIYGNSFINMGNSGVFLDGYFGGFSNCEIYNNLIYMNIPVTGSWYPRGMDIIADAAAVAGPLPFVNIIAANNTFANFTTLYAMSFYPPPTGVGATYVNCIAANNIAYNGNSGFDFTGQSGFTATDNIYTSGSVGFVNTLTYDFHLTALATLFTGKGANESSYFTIDKDGNFRPATGAWDVGAYAYTTNSSGTVAPPAPSGLQILLSP
jgi:hypothetical protein